MLSAPRPGALMSANTISLAVIGHSWGHSWPWDKLLPFPPPAFPPLLGVQKLPSHPWGEGVPWLDRQLSGQRLCFASSVLCAVPGQGSLTSAQLGSVWDGQNPSESKSLLSSFPFLRLCNPGGTFVHLKHPQAKLNLLPALPDGSATRSQSSSNPARVQHFCLVAVPWMKWVWLVSAHVLADHVHSTKFNCIMWRRSSYGFGTCWHNCSCCFRASQGICGGCCDSNWDVPCSQLPQAGGTSK